MPRVFVTEIVPDEPIDLPREEVEKLRKVLRLAEGSPIAVLPNNGSLIRCEFRARQAHPQSVEWPGTEPTRRVTIIQALPKADKLDTIVRQCTEIGVVGFVFFPAERSIVRWDEQKTADRIRRLEAIVREAAEQSYRCKLPTVEVRKSLAEVLKEYPEATVLSEVQGLDRTLNPDGDDLKYIVGPEGGWAPRELALIGERSVTLGPRVLRVDTASVAVAALALLGS